MEEEGSGVSFVDRSGVCQWLWDGGQKDTVGVAPCSWSTNNATPPCCPLPNSGHGRQDFLLQLALWEPPLSPPKHTSFLQGPVSWISGRP